MRTVADIIKDAGGPSAIATESKGSISVEAVYKWPRIGIPDRHWAVVMPRAKASAHEMLLANTAARSKESAA
jgi:hypothetical protein